MHKFAKLIAGMRKEIKQQSKEISKLSNKIISLESKKRGAHEVHVIIGHQFDGEYTFKFSIFDC